MAIYRNVHLTFWSDTKVVDEFTPEDKYFYLYLMTNPHTNLCGCYEISIKQISREMGYTQDSIESLIKRFSEIHNVIRYDSQNKEMLLLNWSKYNWTKSTKFTIALEKEVETIKNTAFKEFITNKIYGIDTVSSSDGYGMDTTVTVSDTDSDSVSASDSITDTNTDKENKSKDEIYKELFENILEKYNISEYLLEAVNNWIEYKKERNFKYKKVGMNNLLKQISSNAREYGDEAVYNVISNSIASGYQGIVFDRLGHEKKGNGGSIDWSKV